MSEWKPYPENKPEKDGVYLVTSGKEKKYICFLDFNQNYKQYDENGVKFYAPAWFHYSLGIVENTVTAFMPLPEPYEKEKVL